MTSINIIKNSKKFNNISDIVINIDLIIDIIKDDINKIAQSKRIFFSDFDYTYSESTKILKKQLQKSHLKSVSKFLKCENIENAVTWLIQRLLNNMRNITTNQKYKLYCSPLFGKLSENIKSNDELEEMLELIELEKFDRDTLKNGLQRLWNGSMHEEDFDYFDMEYLCKKFDLSIKDVFGTDDLVKLNLKKEQVLNGGSQLAIVF